MNSREIAIKFKKFINSFDADPYEVAVCVASYLNQEGIDDTGSPHYIDIRLFDEEEYNMCDCCKDMTNGDMLKAIFPNIVYHYIQTTNESTDFITYSLDGIVGTCVESKWWNAPYERS